MFRLTIVGSTQGFDIDTRRTVGRLSRCPIQLINVTVSKEHCTVEAVRGQYVLVRDLGSLNGVTVNGQRIKGEAKVFPGSEIGVGTVRLLVEERLSEEASQAVTPRIWRGVKKE